MKTATEYLSNGFPVATAMATFLSPADGGRQTMPHLSGVYRPHIVLQSPSIRQATTDEDGKGNEAYLGVQFFDGTNDGDFDIPHECSMVFMYYGRVDYGNAKPNSTFTIREGARVVGFGTIQQITYPTEEHAG